jgi:hypothetical protein
MYSDIWMLKNIFEDLFHGAGITLPAFIRGLTVVGNSMAAQEELLFHQMNVEIIIGQITCGCQAGYAAADDHDRSPFAVQGPTPLFLSLGPG